MPSAKVADRHCPRITTALQYEKPDDEEQKRENQLYKALAIRRKELETRLLNRLDELREACLREGELTGELPVEIYKTLMPGELEPKVKKRVGTTFKYTEQVLLQSHCNNGEYGNNNNNNNSNNENENNNEDEMTFQLEADIELHRKIVAAAERLAKDKTTNKSVRKKRRKDWQAATQRLKGLEKGLYKLRVSSSKPDVSAGGNVHFDSLSCTGSVGSGFSLNSLKGWSNITGYSLRGTIKSCPATPQGSVRDLSGSEAQLNLKCNKFPSTSSDSHNTTTSNTMSVESLKDSLKSKLIASITPKPSTPSSGTNNAPSTSNASESAQLPPLVPSRRTPQKCSPSIRADSADASGQLAMDSSRSAPFEPPLYANIGYSSSAPYKSSYRQMNFPTFQESRQFNITKLSTRFSVEKASNDSVGYVIEYLPSQTIQLLSKTGQVIAGIKHQHQTDGLQYQRCSTSSQSSSISIGSLASTISSASSGYNSLISGVTGATGVLLSGAPAPATSRALSASSLKWPSMSTHSTAGFPNSTTSLDRRIARTAFSASALLATSVYDNIQSNAASQEVSGELTTTFPVNNYCRPLERADFAKFRSNSSVYTAPRDSLRAATAAGSGMQRTCASAREFPRYAHLNLATHFTHGGAEPSWPMAPSLRRYPNSTSHFHNNYNSIQE